MSEFLTLQPPRQALALLLKTLPLGGVNEESIPITQALGRVTAEQVLSTEALPGFNRSSVDGFAVRAEDTFGASDALPVYLKMVGEVPMGSQTRFSLIKGSTALIHTGGMLPEGSDAVVMVEETQESRQGEIEILKAVAVAENVILAGEDVQRGEVVFAKGHRLKPADIGGLAALGMTSVGVKKKPLAAIISSGDEIVPPENKIQPGQVRDVNTYLLAALVERAGGLALPMGIVTDRRDDLLAVAVCALSVSDLVVITAGSSASTRDLTASVMQELGEPGVLVHGINIRPGKPTILGVCAGKAVIGLPGNPVSALVIAGLFVVPVINHLLEIQPSQAPITMQARLAVNLSSRAGRVDYVPIRLFEENGIWQADPIFYKSNLIFSLVKADGLICIPADANGLPAGAIVEVIPL